MGLHSAARSDRSLGEGCPGRPARATFELDVGRDAARTVAGVMLVVYLLIPLMLVVSAALFVAAALARAWWSGHGARDPVSSIHSFHRALEAMQPDSARVDATPPTLRP
ncbi:MAG: hypothetical protein M3O70_21380 [Actinomycetota bacterium]|nr:hypothetical protein [Actinomycetota bacterium]